MLYRYFSIRGVRGSIIPIPIPHISSYILSGWLKAVAQPFVETARQNGNRHKSAAGWCVFFFIYFFQNEKTVGKRWMVGIFTENWLNGYYFSIWTYLNKSPCWLINMSNHQAVDQSTIWQLHWKLPQQCLKSVCWDSQLTEKPTLNKPAKNRNGGAQVSDGVYFEVADVKNLWETAFLFGC